MKLIIGKKIPVEKYTNVYRVTIIVMHGDADKYEDVWDDFNDYDFVCEIARFWNWFNTLPHNKRINVCDNGFEDYEDNEEVVAWLQDLLPQDITVIGSGIYAYPQSCDVTYFDENGDEYEVSYT